MLCISWPSTVSFILCVVLIASCKKNHIEKSLYLEELLLPWAKYQSCLIISVLGTESPVNLDLFEEAAYTGDIRGAYVGKAALYTLTE